MSVQLSNKSKPNNGVNESEVSSEGLSPDRCPIGEQAGPGRHRTTADRRTMRRKWSQKENRVVMQCSYIGAYGRNEYRKRKHAIRNEFKERRRNERRNVLKQKKLHGQFFNQIEEVAGEEKWLWVRDGSIKRKT